MAIPIPQSYDIVETLAVDRAREFLRPRSPAETLQVVFVLLWFLIAMLVGPNEIQYYLFIITILIIFYTAIISFYRKEISRSIAGSALRLGIFLWLFIFLKGIDLTNPSYIQTQVYILSSIFLLGLLTRQAKSDLLSSHKIADYWDFIGNILMGVTEIGIVILILYHFNYLPSSINNNSINLTLISPPIQVTPLAITLLLSVSSYILAGLSPQSMSKQRLLTAQSLVLLPTTRFERFRSSAFIAGFILILITYFNVFNNELIDKISITTVLDFFKNVGAVLFVLGLIMFIFGSAFTGQRKKTLKDYTDAFQANNPLKSHLNSIKSSVENVTITPENQKFYKLKADTPISFVGNAQNKFLVKKDSISIPLTDTPEGTTMVVVGDSETIASNNETTKNSGATTMIVPKHTWNSVSEQLELIVPSDAMIQSLKMKGIESKEKLVSLANQALDGLKKWQGPNELISKLQADELLSSIQSGRYGITSDKNHTRVKLPGITVIDFPQLNYVNVLGIIKVLEIPALDLTGVDLPFIKVLERSDYEFVQMPFLTVLDTSEGELVKLGGFTITDGDRNAIESGIQRALTEQSAFTKLTDGTLDKVFADPDKTLIFTQSLAGEEKLLMGNDQESIIQDIKKDIVQDIKSSKHKKEKHSHKRYDYSDEDEHSLKPKQLPEGNKGLDMKMGPIKMNLFSRDEDQAELDKKERVKVTPTKKMIISPTSLSEEPDNPITKSITDQSNSPISSPKKLIVDSEGKDHYPICPMCKEDIISGGIKCPHCETLFHKSHYLPWVRDTGQCYTCKNIIELEFK